MNSRTVSEAYSAKIGFTGKIPDCPDFISRFLPPSFTSYWNGWVDEGMQHSQRLLGEEWRQAFLVSPVWHFSILPGVLGDTGWLGVVIPSVDKAGRYYPLTVASPLFLIATTILNQMRYRSVWRQLRLLHWMKGVRV